MWFADALCTLRWASILHISGLEIPIRYSPRCGACIPTPRIHRAQRDPKEYNEPFRLNTLYTWGQGNKLKGGVVHVETTTSASAHQIFDPDAPGGLSLCGLDHVYTAMLLYMASAYLLFELVIGW